MSSDEVRTSLEKIFTVPVENKREYLVPLRDVVKLNKTSTPLEISRLDYKRTTTVFAAIKEKSDLTPLDIAEVLEEELFPELTVKYPSAQITFEGEIKDTRESKSDFALGIILVLVFIYIILALLFDSLFKPFLIMIAIPFGIVGIIITFWLHGISEFGFFAGIGALGLAGIVINDSIIMLVKLDKEYEKANVSVSSDRKIARIAQTRLRAVLLTTITTAAGLFPTAYGFAGYDELLAQMMLAMAWGLVFGTTITLIFIPCLYSLEIDLRQKAAGFIRKLTNKYEE